MLASNAEPYFIEVDCQQKRHEGERICGDVFLTRRAKEENRIVVVLSDGMGHGVKANILATLTATMALKFTLEHKAPQKTAEIIMNTLPECSVRKMSYSTFTIIDIDIEGTTTILEFDNPGALIFRNNKPLDVEWKTISLESGKSKGKNLRTCTFTPQKNDRIILCTDGVVQSGLGTSDFPTGWSHAAFSSYTLQCIDKQPDISARQLASKVLNVAFRNDIYHLKDDTSVCALYFREPRRLLICTGPPYNENNDIILAKNIETFDGIKIVMGGTTSEIISRELKLKISDKTDFPDPDLPPMSAMEGIDLVTEGILTLAKVEHLLINFDRNMVLGKGPADMILRLIRECDEIHFNVGTRINIAHQDPLIPVELEIRRAVIKRITLLLEEKLLKKVYITYL